MEAHHHPGFASLQGLLRIGVGEDRQAGAIHPHRGLDHHGHVVLLGLRVGDAQILARVLAVARKVPVAPVVNALNLLPAEGEEVLDVLCRPRVVGEFVRAVGARRFQSGRGGEERDRRALPGHEVRAALPA